MRFVKKGMRVLGVDDSPFDRQTEKVLVVGVVYRNGIIEGVLSTGVERDGWDSTDRLARMISKSRFKNQLKAVLLNSITLAGFNIVDINELFEKTGVPIATLARKKPDMEAVKRALARLPQAEKKLALLEKAGKIHRHKYYIQTAGMSFEEARRLIDIVGAEPVRLAHIIGAGVVSGESKGRL